MRASSNGPTKKPSGYNMRRTPLQLLEMTLAGIEAGAKAAYFEPISRRLRPRIQRLFGSSELFFKDEFTLDAFERGGVREDIAELSDGTREQLSILVRVAFAEVLAENGYPTPLVLDDPLAYSDDGRLAAMCGELAAAKTVSQIILLTCREKAFEVLPSRRLTVTNWRPEKPKPIRALPSIRQFGKPGWQRKADRLGLLQHCPRIVVGAA